MFSCEETHVDTLMFFETFSCLSQDAFFSYGPKSPDSFGSLPIVEVSFQSPESKNNLPNFKNVDGILFNSFSPTFLVFHVDFFQKSREKLPAITT